MKKYKGRKKRFVNIVVIVCLIGAIVIGGISLCRNENFWNVNAAQVLTLIVTICIAFWATQSKNDERKKKDHAEQILRKIQMIVTNEAFYCISTSCDVVENKKKMTMTNRSLNNAIDILKKYGSMLNFNDAVEYIEKEFKDYRELVSEHCEDLEYLNKSESTLKKYADNIDNKCDSIILDLY